MKKVSLKIGLFSFLIITLASFVNLSWTNDSEKWNKSTPVSEALRTLGKDTAKHFIARITAEQVKRGREIIHEGSTIGPDGKQTFRQSRYFVCTDCHNTQQEDPNLRVSDPEARMDYTVEKDIPFLPATTLWGIVNRESWYNDDYIKKYGDLVIPASKSLRESIHLCAVECSQGRPLEDWETEAVLAYFWSIEITLGDLDLSQDDWKKLRTLNANEKNDEAIEWLKSFYLQKSPATFLEKPSSLHDGYSEEGNPESGRKIYERSCMYCHGENRVSKYLLLDNEDLTFNFLKRHMTTYDKYSLYKAVRDGTYAIAGHKAYMPHYTKERMSNQQVEDLRAYIEQQAKL